MALLRAIELFLRAWFLPRLDLAAENLALRQQLAVLKQSTKRPNLRLRDRVFWTWLMRFWPECRSALLILQPEIVIGWHRQGVSVALGVEVESKQARSPSGRIRRTGLDSADVQRDSDPERSAYPVRAEALGT